ICCAAPPTCSTPCATCRWPLPPASTWPTPIWRSTCSTKPAHSARNSCASPTSSGWTTSTPARCSICRRSEVDSADWTTRSARSALWLAQGVGVPWLLFECHYILGRVLGALAEPERAYVAYREATEALERVRSELQPEELRISLVSDKTDVYQELVLLCLDRS